MTIKMMAAAAVASLLATSAGAQSADWREVAPENLMVIDTSKGQVLVELEPRMAPRHVERIRTLTERGFYDGLKFHRVIPNFMAQTGDPQGTGAGGSDLPDVPGEFSFRRGRDSGFAPVENAGEGLVGIMGTMPIATQPDAQMFVTADLKTSAHGLFCPGVAGMARANSPDSANSQFFLMRQPYPPLDKRYTIWGKVVSGLDVVRALKFSPNPDGLVTDPDRMERVRVVADMTEGNKPSVRVLDPASARFRALVEATRQARGADFSVCDIDIPVQVS